MRGDTVLCGTYKGPHAQDVGHVCADPQVIRGLGGPQRTGSDYPCDPGCTCSDCEREVAEYEAMAERCAKAKLDGDIFCGLAGTVSAGTFERIDADQAAFKARVREYRYAMEMERLAIEEE